MIGEWAKTDAREFITPTPGEDLDWVLVLDDALKKFAAPEVVKKRDARIIADILW